MTPGDLLLANPPVQATTEQPVEWRAESEMAAPQAGTMT